MYISRIYIAPEPKTEYKDRLYRIPTLVVRILLFISFVYYGWHMAETMVNSLPYMMMGVDVNYTMAIVIGHLMDGVGSLIIFELVGGVYYGFIRPICPPVPLSKNAFMIYLRAAYILRNVIAGTVKIFVYQNNLYLFSFDSIINLSVTVLILSSTCVYVMSKYVPKIHRARFLRAVSAPFLTYQFIITLMGFVG